MHHQVPCTRKKMISLGSRLIVCCKLTPNLARQMWRHNYVIGCNEYLIFTFSESVNPLTYSQQFLFKSTNNSWGDERKCEWVFFFWTQCRIAIYMCVGVVVDTCVSLSHFVRHRVEQWIAEVGFEIYCCHLCCCCLLVNYCYVYLVGIDALDDYKWHFHAFGWFWWG